jgi:hypothetical protein
MVSNVSDECNISYLQNRRAKLTPTWHDTPEGSYIQADSLSVTILNILQRKYGGRNTIIFSTHSQQLH